MVMVCDCAIHTLAVFPTSLIRSKRRALQPNSNPFLNVNAYTNEYLLQYRCFHLRHHHPLRDRWPIQGVLSPSAQKICANDGPF